MSASEGFSDEQIAQVAHNLHASIRRALGDDSLKPWSELAPDAWERDSTFAQIERLRNDPDLTPESEHEDWRAARTEQGWTYGAVRDNDRKVTPLLVPWGELPFEYRAKSDAVMYVIRALLGQN